MKNLVIVESPTKAKTLNKFLGNDYDVVASMGHVRDIPSNRMNIDIANNFEPVYELMDGKGKVVTDIKRRAKSADNIYIATDPDREGESIGYHIQHILEDALKKTKKDFKRITFHQITKSAVEEAISHAGEIDTKLVEAQQARRILDRLVGYSLSPVLWRKVRRGLSAGRVQSVALKLIVEREKEIQAFKPKEYWEVAVEVIPAQATDKFWIDLYELNGKRTVTGKGDDRVFVLNSKEVVEPILAELPGASYVIDKVTKKEKKQQPKPPYTTSTLQQAAANSLGWTAKRTMSVAQRLYENGLITYHRTDSLHLANEALDMARDFISKTYDASYLPDKPRHYKTSSKSAQEAHEAIRPTDVGKQSSQLAEGIDAAGQKLYSLIRKRFLSCQMTDAIFDSTVITVEAKGEKNTYGFKVTGAIMRFDGWKILYKSSGKTKATADKTAADTDVELPDVQEKQSLAYQKHKADQKQTLPPPRFNDASLIKTLEKLGIGRPSTYAPTISTLMNRGYMDRQDRKFFPTAVGITVTDFLDEHFNYVMDYGFTADMEGDLDKIAEGKLEWVPMMQKFWKPFEEKVKGVTDEADRVKVPVEKLDKPCPKCGKEHGGELVVRTGRYGKFISCSRFPECKHTDKLVVKIDDVVCEKCGKGEVHIKKTRTGRTFYGCSRYPDCDWASWTAPDKKEQE